MDAPFYTSDLNIPLKCIAQSLRTGRRLTKWLKLGCFTVKVSPFGGEYAGEQRCRRMWACGGRDAYHYLFGVQTNSEMGTNQ